MNRNAVVLLPRFEDVFPTLPGTGWLTENEARLLWDAARRTEGPILECGCYHGRSTILLAALGRPVHVVDPFAGFDSDDPTGEKTELAFLLNINERKITNVGVAKMRIEDWKPVPCSFAYLDGDHGPEGTRVQIQKALTAGAKVIACHDVNDDGEGLEVKNACLELLGGWNRRVERLAVWYDAQRSTKHVAAKEKEVPPARVPPPPHRVPRPVPPRAPNEVIKRFE